MKIFNTGDAPLNWSVDINIPSADASRSSQNSENNTTNKSHRSEGEDGYYPGDILSISDMEKYFYPCFGDDYEIDVEWSLSEIGNKVIFLEFSSGG